MFSEHSSSHIDIIKIKERKEGKNYPCDENSLFYFLNNFAIYHTIALAVVMFYITTLVLIYLVTESLYVLNIFLQFPLSQTPTCSSYKFYLFVLIWCGVFIVWVFFLDSTYNWDNRILPLSDLFHLAYCPQGPSMLSQIVFSCVFNGWIIFHCMCIHIYIWICMYIKTSLSVSPLMNTDCFHVSAIVSNASVNTGVQISFQVSDFVSFG